MLLPAFSALALILAAPVSVPSAPAISAPSHAGSATGTLTLTFETGASTGKVMVVLFDSEAAYSGGQPVASAAVPASGPVVAVFENLPDGDYAVKAFHDLNDNGRMDTNPFGSPVEPYAFSNNAVGNMGPATWAQAHFTVSGPTAQILRIR